MNPKIRTTTQPIIIMDESDAVRVGKQEAYKHAAELVLQEGMNPAMANMNELTLHLHNLMLLESSKLGVRKGN